MTQPTTKGHKWDDWILNIYINEYGYCYKIMELTEEGIPGPIFNEPLESATVYAIHWWLLCHDV